MEENNSTLPSIVNQNQTNNPIPQNTSPPLPENPSNIEHLNIKTNKLSIISITMILIWFGVVTFMIPSIGSFLGIGINSSRETYSFVNRLPWVIGFITIFISIGILILFPPLAFFLGFISLKQSNNTKIGKLCSIFAVISAAPIAIFFAIAVFYFFIKAFAYMSGGTGPY